MLVVYRTGQRRAQRDQETDEHYKVKREQRRQSRDLQLILEGGYVGGNSSMRRAQRDRERDQAHERSRQARREDRDLSRVAGIGEFTGRHLASFQEPGPRDQGDRRGPEEGPKVCQD